MVGATGFEPVTTRTPSVCATRLRYAPTGLLNKRNSNTPLGLKQFIPNSAVEYERGANLERRRHPDVLFQSLFCRLAQCFITLTKIARQRDMTRYQG